MNVANRQARARAKAKKNRQRRWPSYAPGSARLSSSTVDRHRSRRGPLTRATGPGCYDEWKAEEAAKRAAKRAAEQEAPCALGAN